MSEDNVSFSTRDVELIKEIVSDWLNEGITLPPFDADLNELLAKLELDSGEGTPEIYPKTQERLSRHGVRK